MSLQIQRRWFNVDEYYRMTDAGILSPDDRGLPPRKRERDRFASISSVGYDYCSLLDVISQS